MKRKTAAIVTIAIIATMLGTVTPAHAAPDNDNYADAVAIEVLPFTDVRDVSEATTEPLETLSSCSNPPKVPAILPELVSDYGSVWYRLEPNADTTITIDPSATDPSVSLAVYEGEDLATQSEVGCSSGPLTVEVAAQSSYAIQVIRDPQRFSTLSFTITEGRPQIFPPDPVFRTDDVSDPATGDATVIAIVDSGISPYHWDFLASRMPQALDTNPDNDLPLGQPPHTWLPRFPDPDAAFASYNHVDLTLEEDDPSATYSDLRPADAEDWGAVRPSIPEEVNYHWFPGTKLIGGVTFAPDGRIEPDAPWAHGHAVASAAVGNDVGTCPECLLVFVQVDPAETAEQSNHQVVAGIEWALEQPWIDIVSSSVVTEAWRTFLPGETSPLWLHSWIDSSFDTALQRSAAQRGQTLFQAGGNGVRLGGITESTFVVPNPTVTTSHMGPDWVVTVGGVSRDGRHLSGAGKQVDVAAPALGYPVSSSDGAIGAQTQAGGTSFSTPAVAGTYAQALYHTRRSLPGPSRTQQNGVIATTEGSSECGDVRPDCELADGALTAEELRTRLFHGAIPTTNGATRSSVPIAIDDPDPIAREWQLLNQGHGTYFGRTQADELWLEEVERVLAPLLGEAPTLERPDAEREWMTVDSYCRQEIWGSWDGGYYVDSETSLPGPDAEWPIRSAIEATCPYLPLPVPTG